MSQRWRTATDAPGLTWGQMLNGYGLAAAITRYVPIGGTDVLEIGPGYGRMLGALAECKIVPGRYVGLDISEHWIRQLGRRHWSPTNRFLVGDVSDAPRIAGKFDLVASFLTFKHIRPDFSAAARLASRVLRRRHGRLIFDLPETNVAWPLEHEQPDRLDCSGTFTRTYRRDEVTPLLEAAGLDLVTFDEVRHTPEKRRLLVVAKKK